MLAMSMSYGSLVIELGAKWLQTRQMSSLTSRRPGKCFERRLRMRAAEHGSDRGRGAGESAQRA